MADPPPKPYDLVLKLSTFEPFTRLWMDDIEDDVGIGEWLKDDGCVEEDIGESSAKREGLLVDVERRFSDLSIW